MYFSLAPGFSPVAVVGLVNQPFQRFPSVGKPLKRLSCRAALTTPLKRGANKRCHPLSPNYANLNNQSPAAGCENMS
jgi:hypothetical protein